MNKTVSSDIIFESLSQESKALVNIKTAKEIEALKKIRTNRSLTQSDIAEKMNLKQNNISELEARADMKISTLKRYAEACGKAVRIEFVDC